jgi:hypothetical protein
LVTPVLSLLGFSLPNTALVRPSAQAMLEDGHRCKQPRQSLHDCRHIGGLLQRRAASFINMTLSNLGA